MYNILFVIRRLFQIFLLADRISILVEFPNLEKRAGVHSFFLGLDIPSVRLGSRLRLGVPCLVIGISVHVVGFYSADR